RMKGNAKSLTIITVLSAMTLATIAGAYALYYSTEREARHAMPQDFLFINEKADAEQFVHLLADHQIDANLTALNLRQFEDRKSTRLNSSHVSISYAVLFL